MADIGGNDQPAFRQLFSYKLRLEMLILCHNEHLFGCPALTGLLHLSHLQITPSMGLEAVAYSFFWILPDSYENLPASTASFIALAILIGSFAPAMPVFIKTAAQPSSIAIAASDAQPTPASTITGTFTVSKII